MRAASQGAQAARDVLWSWMMHVDTGSLRLSFLLKVGLSPFWQGCSEAQETLYATAHSPEQARSECPFSPGQPPTLFLCCHPRRSRDSAASHSLDSYCASCAAARPGLSPGSRTGLRTAPIPAAPFLQSPAPLTGFIAGHPTSRSATTSLRQHRYLSLRPESSQPLSSAHWYILLWGGARRLLETNRAPTSCFLLRPRAPWLGL